VPSTYKGKLREREKKLKGKLPYKRVFIIQVKGTFFGMSESEEASKRR
jgi:hypothetical protein